MQYSKKRLLSLVVLSVFSSGVYAECSTVSVNGNLSNGSIVSKNKLKSMEETIVRVANEKIRLSNNQGITSSHISSILHVKDSQNKNALSDTLIVVAPLGSNISVDNKDVSTFVSMEQEIRNHGNKAIEDYTNNEKYSLENSLAVKAIMVQNPNEVYPVRYLTVMGLQKTTDEHSINIGPSHIDSTYITMDQEIRNHGNKAIEDYTNNEKYSLENSVANRGVLINNSNDVYPIRYTTMMGLQKNVDESSVNVGPAHFDAKFVTMDYEIKKLGAEAVADYKNSTMTSTVGKVLLINNSNDVYPIRYTTMMGLQKTVDEHSINIAPSHLDARYISGMDDEISKHGTDAINSYKNEEIKSQHIKTVIEQK